MIGKIRKGKSFAGLGRYLYGPGRKEEHVNARIVDGESVMLDDTRGWRPWAADMAWCAERNIAVQRPVWHCSLRADPQDAILPDAQWAAIAREHITAMGLAEHPWVAVRHGEDHIHIVACRVDAHGKVWSDQFDYKASMDSVRAIEARHELTRWTPARKSGRLATTSIAEREKAARRGVDPERVRLREAMHAAADAAAGRGIDAWHRELERRGVEYVAHTTKDRRVIGYRVTLPGWKHADGKPIWLKASSVDRRLSWTKLRTRLGATPGRDRLPAAIAELLAAAFPRTAADAARAGAQARAAQQASRTPAARPVVPRPVTSERQRGDDDRGR